MFEHKARNRWIGDRFITFGGEILFQMNMTAFNLRKITKKYKILPFRGERGPKRHLFYSFPKSLIFYKAALSNLLPSIFLPYCKTVPLGLGLDCVRIRTRGGIFYHAS